MADLLAGSSIHRVATVAKVATVATEATVKVAIIEHPLTKQSL